MDKTLRSYLQQADDVHEYLEKYCISLSADQIEEKVRELQASIKTLQSVSYQLANISNIANRVVHNKRKHKEKNTKFIDPYPTEYDIGVLRSLNPVSTYEIVKGINIPIKLVQTSSEIPVCNLYYVADIKQFAINIEGIVIRGNLGNISDYKAEGTAFCEYGTDCNSFKSKTDCPYYHDPTDFIKHGLPVPDKIKNFTTGSWIYSKKKNPRTYFTRHIGSKDRLIVDINTLKLVQFREEVLNRESQLIHDLIIYMALNSRGLLTRYHPWKHIPKKDS